MKMAEMLFLASFFMSNLTEYLWIWTDKTKQLKILPWTLRKWDGHFFGHFIDEKITLN